MELHVLPVRAADAAGNMAIDFLLFRRAADPWAVRFRHYEWRRPAFTFGYAQKIAFIRTCLPPDEAIDLTRRATGGGLVDHREDWTYALVLPRGTSVEDQPGPAIYRTVHQALADALNALGADVRLENRRPDQAAGICFARAEIDDLVCQATERKVAGAAMKRAKTGVLLQGSIWKPFAPTVDWDALQENFPTLLARTMNAEASATGWPDFDPDEEEALVSQYAAPEWIERR